MPSAGDSGRKRSQTLVFVALLSFVGILAPVVYHQQHMHHPVVRRQRNERVVLPRSEHFSSRNAAGHDDDAVDDSLKRHHQRHHGLSHGLSGGDDRHGWGGRDARAGDVVTFDPRHDHVDHLIDDGGGGGVGDGGGGGGGNGGQCDVSHGFLPSSGSGGDKSACESCLALWHGPRCDSGDIFVMPKGTTPDPKRSRRLPAQYTGDVLMNRRQLAASGSEIKVHLPGKTPPWRTIAKAKDAMDLVPARDLVGKKYAKCAIVGNSGMLVYSKNGAEIDSHDMVMRFNGAPTKGLEDRVGSKTTFRLVNSKWTEFREFKDEIVLWNMRGVGAFEDFQLRRKNNGKDEQFHILSADFVNYVGEMAFQLSNSFATSDPTSSDSDPDEASLAASAEGFNSGDYTPTSGWTGLILAASVCGKITLYGMQISEEQGVPYHYHNRCPQPYSARDTAEWLMFRRFVRAGLATFKEPCIEECHEGKDRCDECREKHPETYGKEAMAEGQRVWDKGPMPQYCLARQIMLDQERKHVAEGGAPYTKEQRDKALAEINAKMAPPASAASLRKQARRAGGGGRGGGRTAAAAAAL